MRDFRETQRLPALKLSTRTTEEERARREPTEDQEVGDFVVPIDEVILRRYSEMTPEDQEAYNQSVDAHDSKMLEFANNAVSNYVEVAPGQMTVEDEQGQMIPSTDGAHLANALCGDMKILMRAVNQIRTAHQVSPNEKKA